MGEDGSVYQFGANSTWLQNGRSKERGRRPTRQEFKKGSSNTHRPVEDEMSKGALYLPAARRRDQGFTGPICKTHHGEVEANRAPCAAEERGTQAVCESAPRTHARIALRIEVMSELRRSQIMKQGSCTARRPTCPAMVRFSSQ